MKLSKMLKKAKMFQMPRCNLDQHWQLRFPHFFHSIFSGVCVRGEHNSEVCLSQLMWITNPSDGEGRAEHN